MKNRVAKTLGMAALAITAMAFAAQAKETVHIGLSVNQSDESMNLWASSYMDAIERYNETSEDYEFVGHVTSAENDVQKQLDDVNSLIELGCKVIMMHSIDTEGCKAAVDACDAAGVYMIEARGMDYDKVDLQFNANDEYAIADSAVQWFEQNVMNDDSKVLKIGAIYGMASMTQQLIRVNEVIDRLQEEYGEDRVIVVDSAYSDWDVQKGMEIMENWLQKYTIDDMNCILNAGSDAMTGCIQAIRAFGGDELCKEFVLQTTDARAAILHYIQDGIMDMTVGLSPVVGGYVTAEISIQAVTGEPGEHNFDIESGKLYLGVESGGIVAIDENNVDEWYDAEKNETTYPTY